ncbi:MAG: hypothetical protein JSU69_01265 [Candidatus Zixiibacteriota bacterium]|nr:MAG: hypothetical protein JSU69_01265 [candidate division Zixibacteria bacterium]
MGFVDTLNRLLGLYLAALKSVGRFRLWLPFFLYAVLQIVLLLLCVSYVNPRLYPVLSPLVSLLGQRNAEMFGHYPELYLLLPYVFQWGKLFLSIIFEGLAIGLTSALFVIAFHSKGRPRLKLSPVFARWPQLLITWAVITGVIYLVNWLVPEIFSEYLQGSPRRVVIFEMVMRIIGVIIYAVFVYAVPAIIVRGEGIVRALKTSVSYFAGHPFFTFLLVLIPFLFTLPTTYLSAKAGIVVTKFSPELMFYILLGAIIVDMVINFVLTGAVVKFLVEDKE